VLLGSSSTHRSQEVGAPRARSAGKQPVGDSEVNTDALESATIRGQAALSGDSVEGGAGRQNRSERARCAPQGRSFPSLIRRELEGWSSTANPIQPGGGATCHHSWRVGMRLHFFACDAAGASAVAAILAAPQSAPHRYSPAPASRPEGSAPRPPPGAGSGDPNQGEQHLFARVVPPLHQPACPLPASRASRRRRQSFARVRYANTRSLTKLPDGYTRLTRTWWRARLKKPSLMPSWCDEGVCVRGHG